MIRSLRSLRWTLLCVLCLLPLSGVTFAAPPDVYDFRLIQAEMSLPAVKVYADIIGVNDVPAKGLEPSLFKAKLGDKPATVTKVTPFEDAGEGIAYVLMVDVSKSLTAAQFRTMRETLTSFLESMSDKDQAALVTYGSQVKVLQDYTNNRGTLRDHLSQIALTDDDTAFYAALEKGLAMARTAGSDVPRYRVVLSLTDGVNDLSDGVSMTDILNLLNRDPIPLYLVGFVDGKPTPPEENALADMKKLARISGGRYYDGKGRDWRDIYFSIVRSIRNVFVLEVDVPGLRSEGQPMTLELSVAAANKTWNEKLNITVPAGGSTGTVEKGKAAQGKADTVGDGGIGQWLYAGAGILVLLGIGIGGWAWWQGRKRKMERSDSEESFLKDAAPGIPSGAVPMPTPNPAMAVASNNLPDTESGREAEAMPVRDASVVGLLVRLTRTHEGPPPNQIDFELSDRVTLGNDPTRSHLVFEGDPAMAPAQCVLVFEEGYVYVEELKTEGTFVNGVAVSGRQRLEEQDILRMGQTEMRITFPL